MKKNLVVIIPDETKTVKNGGVGKLKVVEIKSRNFDSEEIFSFKNSDFLYWVDKYTNSLVVFDTKQIDLSQVKMYDQVEKKIRKLKKIILKEYWKIDESKKKFQFHFWNLESDLKSGFFKHEIQFFSEREVIVFSEEVTRKRWKSFKSQRKRKRGLSKKMKKCKSSGIFLPKILSKSKGIKISPKKKKKQLFEFFTFDLSTEKIKIMARFSHEIIGEKINSFAPITLDGGRILVTSTKNSLIGYNFFSFKLTQRFEFNLPKRVPKMRYSLRNVKGMLPLGYVEEDLFAFCIFTKCVGSRGFRIHNCFFVGDFEDGEFHLCNWGRLGGVECLPKGWKRFDSCAVGRGKDKKEYVIKVGVKISP